VTAADREGIVDSKAGGDIGGTEGLSRSTQSVFIKVSKAQRVQGDGVSTGNQEGTCIVSVKGVMADREGTMCVDVSDKLTDSGAAKKLLLPRSGRVGRVDKARKDVFSLHVGLGEPSAPDVNAPRLVARRDASRRHHNEVKSVKEVRACYTQLTLKSASRASGSSM
jgi:hypothetical protein